MGPEHRAVRVRDGSETQIGDFAGDHFVHAMLQAFRAYADGVGDGLFAG